MALLSCVLPDRESPSAPGSGAFDLTQAPPGLWLRVLSVRPSGAAPAPGEGDVARRLTELGFYPGERARVRRASLMGGPMAVSVGGSLFALRPFEAALIEVEPLPAGETRSGER